MFCLSNLEVNAFNVLTIFQIASKVLNELLVDYMIVFGKIIEVGGKLQRERKGVGDG